MQLKKPGVMTPSIRKILLFFLALTILLMAVGAAILVRGVQHAEDAAREAQDAGVEAALTRMDNVLQGGALFLADYLTESANVRAAAESDDVLTRNGALRRMYKAWETQGQYMQSEMLSIAYFCPDSARGTWLGGAGSSYDDNVLMRGRLLEQRAAGTLAMSAKLWSCEIVNGNLYFVKVYNTERGMIAGWVAAETLLAPVRALLPEDALAGVFLPTGKLFVPEAALEACGIVIAEDGTVSVANSRYMLAEYVLPRSGCRLLTATEMVLRLDNLMLPIICVALVVLLLLGFTAYTLYYFSHYIAKPLASFKTHATAFSREAVQRRRRGFAELNEAVDAFDALTEQLEALKIGIYEERLALAKTELEYYQLQIKPHFFVNCFGLIYNLAEQEEFDTIRQFCLSLSNYVRYLFRDGFSTVSLREELELMDEFLSVQNTRYCTHSLLCSDVPEELLGARLPPLLLMTFVENSVKHAQNRFDLGIVVEAEIENDAAQRLCLSVTDNGPGLTPEGCEALNRTACGALPDGVLSERHVGVRNIAKRLSLLYGDRFSLHFENLEGMAHTGTCVTVSIPLAFE